ncbi:MAG: RnfABCDGE type electron transport complex subunit D [Deltaproteobacteria bacterium]|nr:RnfABCDGE type electron transport complex subunit D [Deltaproteobacteria bacterium]
MKGNNVVLEVAPSPHIADASFATKKMMADVIIGLLPVIAMAVYMFRLYAVKQMGICLFTCLAVEAAFTRMRQRPFPLMDLSAAVTGLILGLSLPVTAPWYVGVIASVVAIGIGKVIFGGLGMNIFNPAMVGRAFVMIAFAGLMAASGYVNPVIGIDAITQATPLTAFKQMGISTPLSDLFFGLVNGSPGEISALACLIGGLYLCIRKVASWEIPAGVIAMVVILAGLSGLSGQGVVWAVGYHLFSGALLFGAFFIATDPVTSPMAPVGKFIFGAGIGFFIMVLRLFSGYPEGVMFAVLLMNAVTPLINRWTIPTVMGEK